VSSLQLGNCKFAKLQLNDNQLCHVDLTSPSPSLNKLNLNFNRLSTFDIGENTLTHLELHSNQLSSLNLRNRQTLTCLTISSNPKLKEAPDLPSSLQELQADRQTILDFDFNRLPRLKVLRIYNGKTERTELRNLPEL
jgi:hypothetical protein